MIENTLFSSRLITLFYLGWGWSKVASSLFLPSNSQVVSFRPPKIFWLLFIFIWNKHSELDVNSFMTEVPKSVKPQIFFCFCRYSFGANTVNVELTHSWRTSLSYRNQSIDLQSKLMGWFLYDWFSFMKELITWLTLQILDKNQTTFLDFRISAQICYIKSNMILA